MKRPPFLLGIALLGLLAQSPHAEEVKGVLTPILQPFVDQQTIAGSVVLIASRDRILDLETVGFRDLTARLPMTADCLFGIASMGKPIAATALMMLVDEGKVQVEDAVEKYIPEFKGQIILDPKAPGRPPQTPLHPVTIWNLLTHTSGLPYSTPEEKPTLDGLPLAKAAAIYGRTPLEFEPGSKYFYSSAGINTAARIVEVVSGLQYEQFLQERLFTPLGMKDTTFWPTEEQLQRQAQFYQANAAKSGLEPACPLRFTFPLSDHEHRFPIPGSGLFSTAPDLVKYCQMILNGGVHEGKRYISRALVSEMTSRQTPEEWRNSYGLGWEVTKESYGHGGSFKTFMKIFPQRNLIVISLEQIDGPWPNQGGDKIFNALVEAAKARYGEREK